MLLTLCTKKRWSNAVPSLFELQSTTVGRTRLQPNKLLLTRTDFFGGTLRSTSLREPPWARGDFFVPMRVTGCHRKRASNTKQPRTPSEAESGDSFKFLTAARGFGGPVEPTTFIRPFTCRIGVYTFHDGRIFPAAHEEHTFSLSVIEGSRNPRGDREWTDQKDLSCPPLRSSCYAGCSIGVTFEPGANELYSSTFCIV